MDLTPENAAEHYVEPREQKAREERRSMLVGIAVFTLLVTALYFFVVYASGMS